MSKFSYPNFFSLSLLARRFVQDLVTSVSKQDCGPESNDKEKQKNMVTGYIALFYADS